LLKRKREKEEKREKRTRRAKLLVASRVSLRVKYFRGVLEGETARQSSADESGEMNSRSRM
jgi:hypothetical protein